MRTALTIILLAASTAVTAYTVIALPYYYRDDRVTLPVLTVVLWLLFAAAVWALRRVPTRRAVVLVLAGAVAIGAAGMAGPPNTSTDSARYAWDGIVQNNGVSPYAHVPADPELAELRPEWLFPPALEREDGSLDCQGERIMTYEELGTGDTVCSAMNRLGVPTIYPPASQLLFAAVRAVVPDEAAYWPMQLAGLLMSLAITVLLLRELRVRGRDVRWAALWAWMPLVTAEAVTNSHIDVFGALLLVLATIAVSRGRRWSGGLALGAAISAKLIPVIGAPALLGRQPWKLVLGSVGIFALLYVPYVLADGIGVLGYLPGYLSEEGYESGERFFLISMILPGTAATIVAALLLAAIAVLVWRKTDPSDPWLGQLIMIGTTLLIVSPRYPWYALLLVPMIAMTGRWEWSLVPLALTERLFYPWVEPARIALVVAIAGIVYLSIRRAESGWPRRALRELRHPFSRLNT